MQPLTSLFSTGKSVSFSCFEIEDWKASSPPPPAVPPCITPALAPHPDTPPVHNPAPSPVPLPLLLLLFGF
ncbi:hypothetical protein D5086_028568 [Populus alba]|uniref:Uncharacterized protein n=1 Tax=Populus alba TaxID=43335 RepID=A0ACC4AYK6_POPAL